MHLLLCSAVNTQADFLPHMFQLFPERDYCMLTVPCTTAPSPLLQHFTRAAAQPGSTFNQTLYLLHRDR